MLNSYFIVFGIFINVNKSKTRICKKIKITFNKIFEQALEDNLINKNPCTKLSLPKYNPKKKRSLTNDEDLLTNIENFQGIEKIYVMLLKYYGLRKEELGLKKQDFDFTDNKFTINVELTFVNSKHMLKNTKSLNDSPIQYEMVRFWRL